MTARPAFGDFLTAARDHASAAAAAHQADRGGEHAQEVADSLLHVITVMGRYLQDIAAVPGEPGWAAWHVGNVGHRCHTGRREGV